MSVEKKRWQLTPAVYVALVRDGRVLLLRRHQTGYRDGMLTLPAGHLEGGETFAQAARRELAEETGVHVAEADLRMAGILHRRQDGLERLDVFFDAARFDGEPYNAEPHKCSQMLWADLGALPPDSELLGYVRFALERHGQPLWAADYGFER